MPCFPESHSFLRIDRVPTICFGWRVLLKSIPYSLFDLAEALFVCIFQVLRCVSVALCTWNHTLHERSPQCLGGGEHNVLRMHWLGHQRASRKGILVPETPRDTV
jgi:hypothetical protein